MIGQLDAEKCTLDHSLAAPNPSLLISPEEPRLTGLILLSADVAGEAPWAPGVETHSIVSYSYEAVR